MAKARASQSKVTRTTTGAVTPSSTRNNLGPLTTTFEPSPDCDACFVAESAEEWHCAAYFTDCHGPRSCVPGSIPWSIWAFYSPGLVCPAGWTTATVVNINITDSIRAIEVIRRMSHDETAAFCCPTGFTFTYAFFDASIEGDGPRCYSTMIEGDFVYQLCSTDGNDELRTVSIGTGVITSTFRSTSIATYTFSNDEEEQSPWGLTTWTASIILTVVETPDALRGAITTAPVVQLV
ncbi:hypothetical protein C8A00DRAFT_12483, partial [Chaetomidium leptoderma]